MPGPPRLTRLGERPAEAEVGVVVHRMGLDDRLELRRRLRVVAGAEERATERLTYRALLRGLPGGLLEGNRRLLEGTVLEQLHPSPVQRIEGFVLAHLLVLGHWPSVGAAATPDARASQSRGSARAVEPDRSASTRSRIASAIASFEARGTR